MKVKLLKKVRQRYTLKWLPADNLEYRWFALDNKKKEVDVFKSTSSLVVFLALEMVGFDSYVKRRSKVFQRRKLAAYHEINNRSKNIS